MNKLSKLDNSNHATTFGVPLCFNSLKTPTNALAKTFLFVPIFTLRQTFYSVAFVCLDCDVRMTKCSASVWKSDHMIHESTSLSQTKDHTGYSKD